MYKKKPACESGSRRQVCAVLTANAEPGVIQAVLLDCASLRRIDSNGLACDTGGDFHLRTEQTATNQRVELLASLGHVVRAIALCGQCAENHTDLRAEITPLMCDNRNSVRMGQLTENVSGHLLVVFRAIPGLLVARLHELPPLRQRIVLFDHAEHNRIFGPLCGGTRLLGLLHGFDSLVKRLKCANLYYNSTFIIKSQVSFPLNYYRFFKCDVFLKQVQGMLCLLVNSAQLCLLFHLSSLQNLVVPSE